MIRRISEAGRFNSCQRYWGLISMKKVIRKRDDFIVDVLFYFESEQRFEYRGDLFSFRGSHIKTYLFNISYPP